MVLVVRLDFVTRSCLTCAIYQEVWVACCVDGNKDFARRITLTNHGRGWIGLDCYGLYASKWIARRTEDFSCVSGRVASVSWNDASPVRCPAKYTPANAAGIHILWASDRPLSKDML
jgi:hypothetical protein